MKKPMVRMIATGRIPRYATRHLRALQAGEEFEAKPADAKIWMLLNKAVVAPRVPGKIAAPPRALTSRIHPLDHDSDGRKGGSPKPEGDLADLRTAYTEKFGKRPFYGWGADILREKMASE